MSERKPKEKKPLFQPGSVLGGETDILGSVLSSYAQSTGQPAPVLRQAEEAELQEPKDPEVPKANSEAPDERPAEAERQAPRPEPARQLADKTARQQKASKPKRTNSASEEAEARSQTPKRLCSYRVPEGLDDWLEEYVFQHRHTGIKKQDLIVQALQLLIVAKSSPQETEEDQI